jgi:hypothetical protein
LLNLAAITLPWIEIVAGVFLVLGIWMRASAILLSALTLVFMVAIGSALARGLDIDCGCFGTVGGRRAGLVPLLEDMVLLLCGLWVVWTSRPKGQEELGPGIGVPSTSGG